MSLPRIVLVGRMNVGKSTLWNRLTETHGALISPIAGTTRDMREGTVSWRGKEFLLVDTGGIDIPHLSPQSTKKKKGAHGYPEASDPFASAIERQTARAVEGAAFVLFVVDGKEGLVPQERVWARALLKSRKPTLLVVNKIDAGHHRDRVHDFWRLGLGEPHAVSAATGLGTGDLLDHVTSILEDDPTPALSLEERVRVRSTDHPIRIALVGRPNVGKSSLVNAVLGEERVIVSSIPHTTREPIDTPFTASGQPYTLIDTAGIRRQARIAPGLERAGVTLTLNTLARADIALFVIEAHASLNAQDMHIANAIVERRVGCVIVANKWDLFGKSEIRNPKSETDIVKKYTEYIRKHLPHLHWAPILFVSAQTTRNVPKILAAARTAMAERVRVIPSETLEEFIKKLVYRPSSKTKKIRTARVYGLTQTNTAPPQFELVTEWTNVMTQRGKQKGTVRESYVRFVENRLREKFGFMGTPIVLTLRTIEH